MSPAPRRLRGPSSRVPEHLCDTERLPRPPSVGSWRGTALAVGVAAVVAIAWTWPLVLHLRAALPGGGAGDNVTFVWNLWWMRQAIATGRSFFHSPMLFAPIGVDLTLDTHTALPAFVGATVLAPLSPLAAQNVVIVAALALNVWCAFRLALRVTSDAAAAIVAGLVFGGSTFLAAHLHGHFNLIHAWTIPLWALAMLAVFRDPRAWRGAIAGLVLGVTAYVCYYNLVYEVALGVLLVAASAWEWSLSTRTDRPRSRAWDRLVAIAIAADTALIVAVTAGRSFSVPLGARRLLVAGTFNPLQIFWALVAMWLLVRFRPRVRVRGAAGWPKIRAWRALGVAVVSALVVAAPIVWNGARLIARGDYVSQPYFWRSAPTGIDLASLLLGNPFHPIWGGAIRTLYARLGVNLIESSAGWMGVVPVALALLALRRQWANAQVRLWTAVAGAFLIWSFGPHLSAFGQPTGMILPETLLRYVPIAANARIPGRAMVVVDLGIALLAALALADWRARARRPAWMLALVVAGLALDLWPSPFPLTTFDHPAIYDTLRDRPESGTVCELPLGLRDGFGELGYLDHRVLFYQTIHGRPIVGGFVARLPASIVTAYRDDPLLSAWLRLSDRSSRGVVDADEVELPDRAVAADRLRRDGIRFIMLDRDTSPPALTDYVEHVLPVTLIARDDERSLYRANAPVP